MRKNNIFFLFTKTLCDVSAKKVPQSRLGDSGTLYCVE